jgi:hypothetical protein
MNLEETLKNFDEALQEFVEKEKYILKNNLSERCITHKLANYLEEKFFGFDVDCEYNRKYNLVEMANDIKRVIISEEEMIEIAKDRINENDTYSVYPDIIVHKRESNNNHLIIEIKKSNNKNSSDKKFDKKKLERFTDKVDNDLTYEYKLGIYLEIGVEEKTGNESKCYFQNGEETLKNMLKNWE